METQTLDELKAENAAKEAETQGTTETLDGETTTAAAEDTLGEAEQESSEAAESSEGESTEGTDDETVEAWMQTEEQASEGADAKFTDGDIGAAKKKLRVKLEAKHNGELDVLKAQIAELQKGPQTQAQPSVKPMPKAEDFEYDDAKHAVAMQEWVGEQVQAQVGAATQQTSQTQAQEQANKHLEVAVDQHYERVAKLASESKIEPEVYRTAELAVRQSVEAALPSMGDGVVDGLISKLGEGSEKVMYFLGRNKTARDKLQAMLTTDQSGIAASMYLGELKGKVSAPQKKTSSAPAPATRVNGDAAGSESAEAKNLKKQYNEAHSANNGQKAFDIRSKARDAGVSVSNW